MPADTQTTTQDPTTHGAATMLGLRDLRKGLLSALDALSFETDHGVLGDTLCEVIGIQTELDSLRLRLVDQCRSNGVPETVGVRTIGQYVASRTNNAAAGSNTDSAMNKWLRDFPAFSAALESRDMTMSHLRHIKTHLSSGRSFVSLRDDQQFLAEAARDCSFNDFIKVCDYWLIHIDPDGEEPQDQVASSGLFMRKGAGGRGASSIQTDAITHAAIKRMIDHQVDKNRAGAGEQTDAALVAGTLPFERLKAMLDLMQKGFQREDDTYPTPLINLVMSPKVVDWATKQLSDPSDGSVPVNPFDVDGRCELIDGTPVHPLLALAVSGLWALDTPTLCRYVLNAKDRIVDYSYNVRVAPEHLRNAVHIEHRGSCGHGGCDAPHNWLQIDHIDPHAHGGPTSLPNSEPACRPDNGAKGAALGHIPHKDRPPPPRYQRPPQHYQTRDQPDDDEDA